MVGKVKEKVPEKRVNDSVAAYDFSHSQLSSKQTIKCRILERHVDIPLPYRRITLYNYMTNIDSNDVRKIAKLVNTQRFDILSFSRANKI